MNTTKRRELRRRAVHQVEQLGAHGARAFAVLGSWEEGYFDLAFAVPREEPRPLLATDEENGLSIAELLEQALAEFTAETIGLARQPSLAHLAADRKPLTETLEHAILLARLLDGTARLQ